MAQIKTLIQKPFPPAKKSAEDTIFQNNEHTRKEGDRIRVLAEKLGVPFNEHGLVTSAVLDILVKNSKEGITQKPKF